MNNEQFGMGNKKGKKEKKTGEKGRARLSKRLCNIELGVKEEWKGKIAEVQESQSRREINADRLSTSVYYKQTRSAINFV